MNLLLFLIQVFVISFSGAMQPGPVTATVITLGTRNRYAGTLLALGHGIIEFPLMVLLILGIGKYFKMPTVQITIGLAGGAFLLLMAVQLFLSTKNQKQTNTERLNNRPILAGIVLSASNPYFLLWWATIGLALATQATQWGIWAFALFALVHWSVDLIWLQILSWASFKGAAVLGPKSQKIILLVCALALFAFGLLFIAKSLTNWFRPPADSVLWLEAEQFRNTAGWSNDSQFVDLMGSPYLLAAGLGKPVADASTTAHIPKTGKYRLWVRCKDWFPTHSPGQFQITVAGKTSPVTFGKAENDAWQWVDGGTFDLLTGDVEIRLHDLTGWWTRCDAIVLAQESFKPANDLQNLAGQRLEYLRSSAAISDMGPYDVVVVGGGLAGCAAAVSAASHGCNVAFVQDRPVLGGNSSSEIQVPVMGHCTWWSFNEYDPDVTGLIEQFYPELHQTGRSKQIEAIVRRQDNIDLFLNTRATGVEVQNQNRIKSVLALDVKAGRRMRFTAPLFIDCTGHGWIGCYAGAEYRQGQEPRSEFNESLAPIMPGKKTMGNNLYHAEFRTHDEPVPFECPQWAYLWTKPEDFEPLDSNPRIEEVVRPENFDRPSRGKGRQPDPNDINGAIYHTWWVEYGGILDTISDAEKIRDELFRINIGLWNYAKNHNPQTSQKNKNREMVCLNYVCGVRESRRLIGDYVMSQQEYDRQTVHKDIIAFTDWGIDVHHPQGFWVEGNDCIHVYGNRRVGIPYRCLYSKNIDNLLMAGRCISVTHIALGGTRIMRTVCMTGQAAGTAAALAHQHGTSPRGVYHSHIHQLQQLLLKDGCYLMGVPNQDQADLARTAKVTASSSADKLGPENVNNGYNRVVANQRNAWAPEPNASLPQWIQLQMPQPSTINTVHVSFQKRDFSAADFGIEVWTKGSFKTAAKVVANQQRRRVLSFEPVETDKIRLVITKASDQFALCEIRIYNEPAPNIASQ